MPDVLACQHCAETVALPCFSDEDLVFRAQSGDGEAVEKLVSRYKSFVSLRSQAFFLAGADRDDVIQEGMIGLYKAILRFDCARGASFKTFAELCINRQILTAVKTASRQKHQPLNSYVSMNLGADAVSCHEQSGFVAAEQKQNPEYILIERENLNGIHGRIDEVLSKFEAEVLMHHLNGLSYNEIAKQLGRDSKAVDNALQRIKRKLEKFLLV